MTPGGRWPEAARGGGLGLAALASLLAHGAGLAGLIWLVQRPPREEPAPERGVEIVWDQDAAEAVSEAVSPEPPGAPPEIAAPEQAEAPPPPPEPPAPPPVPLVPTPLPQLLAQAPVPLPLSPDPPLELPRPDLTVAPPPPEPPAPEPPPPEPPPPEPPPPEPPPPEPRPPEPPRQPAQRARPTPPPRPPARSQPPTEANRAGEEAAAAQAAGLGRATGAVVPPGPDARYQNAAPGYPEMARMRGEQGSVALEISVGTDGRPIQVTVARSSGSPMLDGAARRAVQEWRFRPAMRDGEPVPGTIRTTVHFRLQ